MKYISIVIVLLLVIGGGLVMGKKIVRHFRQSEPPQEMKEEMTMTPEPTKSMTMSPSTTSAAMNEAEKDITVTGSNFKFEPSTITVKKGQKVKITFTNAGGMHDFVIDEFNVKTKMIQTGQSDTVEFTPDKTGTFQYYCSVGNHRAMGMQGTLTVE